MKVAVTVWGDRISPLFDATRMLLIADIEGRRISGKHREAFNCNSPFSRAERLADLGVTVLVCGGISNGFARLIEARRIKLIPFVAGAVDEVLEAYVTGRLFNKKFRMPGCGTGHQTKDDQGD